FATQRALDGLDKVLVVCRLLEERRDMELSGGRFGDARIAAGEHHDRDGAEVGQVGVALQHYQSVSRGQPEVQQHHIGALAPGHADSSDAVLCSDDRVSGVLQSACQATTQVVVVLNNENLCFAHGVVAHAAASGLV